ncbi:MAG: hypothetical protein AUI14_06170 [Actinobacteria bacterium 13_2_20CM_2_71_6]|nr:MAG: hypothetical protein AUI14_06170 [Actinobacteria bacterium 13_2_20CM_2_71_6]
MRFRLLGPVEVESDDGRVHALARRQERAVLAILLLETGRIVPVDRLCLLLWDDDPPRQARRAVHAHVARIRAVLARAGAGTAGAELVSHRDGYLIQADPATIDVHRFRRLLGQAGGTTDLTERDRLLRDALALWRGPALHNAASDRLRERLCAELDEQRLQAVEASIATGLELGRHRELLPELARLTAEDRVRERLVELHMLALYRYGRTAEALDVYRHARDRIADELGLEPGPGLRQLHQTILRGAPLPATAPDPPVRTADARVTPAQLPPDQSGFTGRAGYLETLDNLLAEEATAAVVISAIAGTAGVGKTALAIHWAHRVRDRFPDGQLYGDLRGYAPVPAMRPIDTLAGFLSALGVPAQRVPSDLDQATGMYRSLLAGRRILVVLDNAASPDQVRPLLPGTAGCVVLITSRDSLGGLVARDGARRVSLDVLTPDEAEHLLTNILGPQRVAAETGATAELARVCAYLPLALRIAAANLTEHPDLRVSDYLDDLRGGDRLSALAVPGDEHTAVRATLELSYAALPPQARRMFRFNGLVPGPDISVDAAAALAGTSRTGAAAVLDRLADAHLLTEHVPGRYSCHDLLRRYATELAVRHDSDPERAAAIGRLYDHYLRTVDSAVHVLMPQTLRLARTPDGDAAGGRFADRDQALAWLDSERTNLVAAVTAAAQAGAGPSAWPLADALHGYFKLRTLIVDWLTVARAGLLAAEAEDNQPATAAAELSLADAHNRNGAYDVAIAHYHRALTLTRHARWRDGEVAALNNLGIVYGQVGKLPLAADHFRQALAINRELGNSIAEARCLCNLGMVHHAAGQLRLAVEHYLQAVRLYETVGFPRGLGIALSNLGEDCHHLGRPVEAREHLRRALLLNRQVGDRGSEAETLRVLAGVDRDTGHIAESLGHAESALAIAQESGDLWLEPDMLNTLGSIQRIRHRQMTALEHHERALHLARERGVLGAEAEALTGLAAVHLDLGDTDGAGSFVHDALTLARRAGHQVREGQALTLLATIDLAADRPEDTIRHGQHALTVQHETGHRFGQAYTHLLLGHAFDRTQQPEAGQRHRQQAHALYADIGVPAPDPWATATAG